MSDILFNAPRAEVVYPSAAELPPRVVVVPRTTEPRPAGAPRPSASRIHAVRVELQVRHELRDRCRR